MAFDQNYSSDLKRYNRVKYQYNGISGGLFHDPVRNQFYDEILKECKGKRCIDVGSGSGMLAFIALKHGAEHVTCFEQNPKSAQHIRTIATKIGFADKINVINTEFKASAYDSYGLKDIDVIFHELIGAYIWDDMIGRAFNIPLPIRILPSNYDIQFNIIELTEENYNYLINLEVAPEILNPFNLGIDLPSEFAEYYQDVIQTTSYLYHSPAHILEIGCYHYDKLTQVYESNSMKVIAHHRFDINDPEHFKTRRNIKFRLPQTDNPYLIVLRPFFYCSKDFVFDFKPGTHFTGYFKPIIVPPKSRHRLFHYDVFKNTLKLDSLYIK